MKEPKSRDPAVVKSTIVDRVYSNTKNILINYWIPPGHQIHIEELANHLNVSVTPVREALNRLLNEGFIHHRGGRGFCNRSIDREELTDLFMLRGSLAISALHFILNTELRNRVSDILTDARRNASVEQGGRIPICRVLLRAVGNKEVLRIYENIADKVHFIWGIYASSPCGRAHIEDYGRRIERLLVAGDLPACIEVIDDNIRSQITALDDIIPQAFAQIFASKQSCSEKLSRPMVFPVPRRTT